MQWRWLALSALVACRTDLQSSSAPEGHLIEIATTDQAPSSTMLDDHVRLWGLFPAAPWLRFWAGDSWAGNGAWGMFGGVIAADRGGDIVIGQGQQVSRVTFTPPSIEPIGPAGSTGILSLATLADGTLAVSLGGSLRWWRPGMTAWIDTGLATTHVPWITPDHAMIVVMVTGDLVRISDPTAPEILASGLDPGLRMAGVDPEGDVVVFDKAMHAYRVSSGASTPLALEPSDTLVRLIATSKQVVAAVNRSAQGVTKEMLVVLGEDGSWTPIEQNASVTLSMAVMLRATPSGDIYVIDGGFVGRIEF